jgi:hypothetical protein
MGATFETRYSGSGIGAMKKRQQACGTCGAPGAKVWHCAFGSGGSRRKILGNRVILHECPACGAFWVFSSHGRDVRSPAGILWAKAEQEWCHAYDEDDGVTLRRWHLEKLRRNTAGVCGERPCRREACRFAEDVAPSAGAAPA